MRADARTPRRGLTGRLAARTPQERAAASVANGIAALAGAEALTAFVSPVVGAVLDALVLVYLLNRSAVLDRSALAAPRRRRAEYAASDLLVVVAAVALVRLVGLATPFDLMEQHAWYAAISTPILAALAAAACSLDPAWIALRPSRASLPADAAVIAFGLLAGAAAAAIPERAHASAGLGWAAFAGAAALAVLVALALDRLAFADGLRAAARAALASPRWPLALALAAIAALALPTLPIAAGVAVSAVAFAAAARAGCSLPALAAAQLAVILLTTAAPL